MIFPKTEQELDRLLTLPSAADLSFTKQLEGDTIVLGAGGKMGPTLARRLAAYRAAARPVRAMRALMTLVPALAADARQVDSSARIGHAGRRALYC